MARSQSSDASPFSAKGGLCDRTLRQMAHGRPTQRGRCSRDHRIRFRPIPDQFRRDGTQASSPYPQTGTGSQQTGKNLGGCQSPGQSKVRWIQRSKITEGFVEEAIPFIKKAQDEGKPFYLNLWPDDVHSPFWPPTAKWGDGSKRRLYLSVLEAMDEQREKLFDFVRNDPQLAHNTVILACSDNGAEKGAGSPARSEVFKNALVRGRNSILARSLGGLDSFHPRKEEYCKVNLKSVFSLWTWSPLYSIWPARPFIPRESNSTENPCGFARQKQNSANNRSSFAVRPTATLFTESRIYPIWPFAPENGNCSASMMAPTHFFTTWRKTGARPRTCPRSIPKSWPA